jgi:hypothetical protein
MSRPKGSKNKNRVSARERYWRAEFRFDPVTKQDMRVRKHRARKEQKAEDPTWAAKHREKLAAKGLLDAPKLVMPWARDVALHGPTMQVWAAKIDSAFLVAWRQEQREIRQEKLREKLLAQVADAKEELRRRRRSDARRTAKKGRP